MSFFMKPLAFYRQKQIVIILDTASPF